MPTFIVVRKEIWDHGIKIEAESKKEAVQKVASGQGEAIEGLFECSRTMDPDTWSAERIVKERPGESKEPQKPPTPEAKTKPVVFMAGNLSEGYIPYGPFNSYDDAFGFANNNNLDGWAMEVFQKKVSRGK